MEVYEFRINKESGQTAATYFSDSDCIGLDEWFGRTLEDFSKGMKGRGFNYSVRETYAYFRHTWTK